MTTPKPSDKLRSTVANINALTAFGLATRLKSPARSETAAPSSGWLKTNSGEMGFTDDGDERVLAVPTNMQKEDADGMFTIVYIYMNHDTMMLTAADADGVVMDSAVVSFNSALKSTTLVYKHSKMRVMPTMSEFAWLVTGK